MKIKTVRVMDFTPIPGGRFRVNGDGSAEQFYEEYLQPILKKNVTQPLEIDMHDTWGYPPSFTSQLGIYLKEHYGNAKAVRKYVIIKTLDPEVFDRFWRQLEEKA